MSAIWEFIKSFIPSVTPTDFGKVTYKTQEFQYYFNRYENIVLKGGIQLLC